MSQLENVIDWGISVGMAWAFEDAWLMAVRAGQIELADKIAEKAQQHRAEADRLFNAPTESST